MDLMADRSVIEVNDGSATRYDKQKMENCAGKPAIDVTIAALED